MGINYVRKIFLHFFSSNNTVRYYQLQILQLIVVTIKNREPRKGLSGMKGSLERI